MPRATSGWPPSTRKSAISSATCWARRGVRGGRRTCRGTYFQLARYTGISDIPDRAFAEWMTREAGVVVIPVSAFNADGRDDRVVRFCFAKREETLVAAGEHLRRL